MAQAIGVYIIVNEQSDLLFHCGKVLGFNPHLRNKATPLHLATNEETKIDDRWQSGIIVFPNDKVAKLLVDCGADINAKNSDGHTPQLYCELVVD